MPCFVEFECDEGARLTSLERVVVALGHAKDSDEWHDEQYWLGFFDDAARTKFWWPTESELASSESNRERKWMLCSMIEAFQNGDYRRIRSRRLGPSVARIEYEPFADPYGGNGCMVALVEVFGFRVSQMEF